MATNNILDDYNNKQLEDICPKTNGEHGYELNNFQWLSNHVCEIEYVCLECNKIRYMYHYLIEEDFYDL